MKPNASLEKASKEWIYDPSGPLVKQEVVDRSAKGRNGSRIHATLSSECHMRIYDLISSRIQTLEIRSRDPAMESIYMYV